MHTIGEEHVEDLKGEDVVIDERGAYSEHRFAAFRDEQHLLEEFAKVVEHEQKQLRCFRSFRGC